MLSLSISLLRKYSYSVALFRFILSLSLSREREREVFLISENHNYIVAPTHFRTYCVLFFKLQTQLDIQNYSWCLIEVCIFMFSNFEEKFCVLLLLLQKYLKHQDLLHIPLTKGRQNFILYSHTFVCD